MKPTGSACNQLSKELQLLSSKLVVLQPSSVGCVSSEGHERAVLNAECLQEKEVGGMKLEVKTRKRIKLEIC